MAAPEDLRACGERIEALLEASAGGGPVARDRAEELVRLVVELYGAGLQRVLEVAHDAGALTDPVLEALAADELVSSLLLVHGLHPYGVAERVERALAGVRPYLASHGGDVELLDVGEDGVVRLRLKGSCNGCASSSVTLKLAVETAIEAAAPEIIRIEVDDPVPDAAVGLIPVSALTAHLHPTEAGTGSVWEPVGSFDELASGGLRAVVVGGLKVIVCRAGSELYAYRDTCPACSASVATAVLQRGLDGSAVLTCPQCRTHYDVRQAGRGIDENQHHLDPLPLLERADGVAIAVPVAVPA